MKSVLRYYGAVKPANTWVSVIGSVVAFVFGFTILRFYPAVLGSLLMLVIFLALGLWYGTWYAKRGKHNRKWLNVLFWSNVVTWIIPAIGLMTCAATYQINVKNQSGDRQKYMILAGVCLVLSAANGFAGALHVFS